MHRYPFLKPLNLLILLVCLCFLLVNVYMAIEYFEETIYNYKVANFTEDLNASRLLGQGGIETTRLLEQGGIETTRLLEQGGIEATRHLEQGRIETTTKRTNVTMEAKKVANFTEDLNASRLLEQGGIETTRLLEQGVIKTTRLLEQGGIETTTKRTNVTMEAQWDPFSMGQPRHMNCGRLVVGDKKAIKEYLEKGRVVIIKDPDLPMDCQSISERIKYNSHTQYSTDIPYAIAVNVYKDYFVIETILGITYSSRNSYCYAMDRNSSELFKTKMKKLAQCLDNVHVLQEEFAFNSKGHFQDHAHFRCTQELLNKGNWSYILYNQNHDLVIRTNSEMSQIINVINGAQLHGSAKGFTYRYNTRRTWTARDLHLFKNETHKSKVQLDTPMRIYKTPNQVFLSRKFVSALDRELNMSTIINSFNIQKYYGTDEMVFATLPMASHLGLPGQASSNCSKEAIIRFIKWCHNRNTLDCCLSNHGRHGVCILTVEYLPILLNSPAIIANKIRAEIDLGTLICLATELQKRSLRHVPMKDLNVYKNFFTVRERALRLNGTFDPKTFKC